MQFESLTGLDRCWVKARRSNSLFLTNKIFAVILAISLACYTASMKPDIMAYGKAYPDATNKNSYNFIYWLLFIYYSFQSLDQLIELYAVYFEREKGALGLLLEMNNFLGIGIIVYLTVFNYKESAELPDEYAHLKTWINFQVLFMYIVLVLVLLMMLCFRSMQKKVTFKADEEDEKKVEAEKNK